MGDKYIWESHNWADLNKWLDDHKGKYMVFKHCDRVFFGKFEQDDSVKTGLLYRNIEFSDVYFISGKVFIVGFSLNGEKCYELVREDEVDCSWWLAQYTAIANGEKIVMQYVSDLFCCEELNEDILKVINSKKRRYDEVDENDNDD
jgi:hypothetical protein